MKNNLKQTVFEYGVTKDLNHKNFFDKENPKRPNDEGRVSSNDDGTKLNLEFKGNDNSKATSIKEFKSEVKNLPVNTVRSLNKSVEPTCYNDVILDNKWIDAMNAEIEALNKNHTWIFTNLPANRKPIGCKWIFKIKYKANGEIERYKERLIAKDLEEDVYMKIPQGFSDKDNKNKSPNDHSLCTKSKDNKSIALLVYVDDIVVTGNYVKEIDQFKIFLSYKFNIKDL
ncbi:ribonuclease H-like domain-containing protein, partial [Tanacetum coccineum]